mgnify:FL=1
MEELFYRCLEEIDLELEKYQIEQFIDYYEIMIETNKHMNLTTITDLDEVIIKHFIDSLVINKVIVPTDESIIDVGTGAGLPGIPIKIAFPDTGVVLLDSLKKRLKFLDQVILDCDLIDIETVHGRAEDIGRDPQYRESFDICVSRAVANLSTLSEYCIPFVKKGGLFIAYKSGNIDEELTNSKNAVNLLGGEIEDVKKLKLPKSDIDRSLVVIRKKKSTLKRYPRSAGKPSREPL